jgi:DNA processing protein
MRPARAGVTVVSGFAEGIDDASHMGALDEGGRTVLCLPFGIHRFRSRAGWPALADLATRAVALTEQPPDADWESQAALTRNRLIAALSHALIVVETEIKGGAMTTFEHALRLGRRLFAVRFQDPPPSARGNSVALGRGAQPLERLADAQAVVEAVNRAVGAG